MMLHRTFSSGHYTSAEHRLCGFEAPEEALQHASEVVKKDSDFLARMAEAARSLSADERRWLVTTQEWKLDTADKLAPILSYDEWNRAWMSEDTYLKPQNNEAIRSPESFLRNLDKETRKEHLLSYLQERLGSVPASVENVIREADFDSKASVQHMISLLQKCISAERKIRNVQNPDLPNTDVRQSHEIAFNALRQKYVTGDNASLRAFRDFRELMLRNTSIVRSVVESPDSFALALEKDVSEFAAAVRLGIFDAQTLNALMDRYEESRYERTELIRKSRDEQQKIRSNIEDFDKRTIGERMADNFRGLETWQKFAVVAAGGYLLNYLVRRKDRTHFEWTLLIGGAAVGFYALGGRQMFNDTPIGTAMTGVEDFLGNGKNMIVESVSDLAGIDKRPTAEMFEHDIKLYARYFSEYANEDLTEEIAAMTYISSMPLGAITSSFSLHGGAFGGELNTSRESSLMKKVKELYGPKSEFETVTRLLRQKSEKLSTGLVHMFYMLGATNDLTTHRKIEEARMGVQNQSYDNLDPATRQDYEKLVKSGIALSATTYKDISLFEAVEKLATQ